MQDKKVYTDDDFLNRGYHEYPRTRLQNNSIVCNFQKRFSDDVGKKYFIDIAKWDHSYIPTHMRGDWYTRYAYECSAQLYQKDKHCAIDIGFHSEWNLDDVEDYLEKLFETGLFDYYEKWDEC